MFKSLKFSKSGIITFILLIYSRVYFRGHTMICAMSLNLCILLLINKFLYCFLEHVSPKQLCLLRFVENN